MSAVTGAPLSVKAMLRAAAISLVLQRLAHLRAYGAKDGLGIERHLRQPHADRVVDGIRDGRRRAEGGDLADALGAEWAVGLVVIQINTLHHLRYIVESGNLVVGERRVGHLAAVEMDLFEHGETYVHQGRA